MKVILWERPEPFAPDLEGCSPQLCLTAIRLENQREIPYLPTSLLRFNLCQLSSQSAEPGRSGLQTHNELIAAPCYPAHSCIPPAAAAASAFLHCYLPLPEKQCTQILLPVSIAVLDAALIAIRRFMKAKFWHLAPRAR